MSQKLFNWEATFIPFSGALEIYCPENLEKSKNVLFGARFLQECNISQKFPGSFSKFFEQLFTPGTVLRLGTIFVVFLKAATNASFFIAQISW